ncbi:MAG TPA: hypothetical protein PKL31_04275 [Fulvivirga sp.]|nr:hypothetical protein [Fulvivirga sp.]
MKRFSFILLLLFVLILSLFAFIKEKEHTVKIDGVSFVAPRHEITSSALDPIVSINAKWLAIIPYAFSQAGKPGVNFNHSHQWWGEGLEGVAATVQMAHMKNLKVMIKPHIWVRGQGWAGDFDLETEEDWQSWEKDYSKYILAYAHLADSLEVELFCIGTEYRKAVTKRPDYWRQLIAQIRGFYKGKITYAANWDNYENIEFWPDLDFIGIDAYFPISEDITPSVGNLEKGWQMQKHLLNDFSNTFNKPILFTEFGYQSVDYTADGHWKHDQDTLSVNMAGQANAYEALFNTYWNEEWFAGGFLWKWHSEHKAIGGPDCKEFTPQNKPAEAIIKKYFGTGDLN